MFTFDKTAVTMIARQGKEKDTEYISDINMSGKSRFGRTYFDNFENKQAYLSFL